MLPLPLLLASAAQLSAATPPANPAVPSRRWTRMFISPMGEPFRPKSRDDDALADWFGQADRNQQQHGREADALVARRARREFRQHRPEPHRRRARERIEPEEFRREQLLDAEARPGRPPLLGEARP